MPTTTTTTTPTTNPRQRLGREGEAIAARFLENRGYRIAARNVRADRVEIDLIARRGPLLVIVEVKARRSRKLGDAANAVDTRKQQRLRRGAGAWLATRPPEARGYRRLRFDVVTCLRIGASAPQPEEREPDPKGIAGPDPIGCWFPNETTAPGGARWWIEHWESAF